MAVFPGFTKFPALLASHFRGHLDCLSVTMSADYALSENEACFSLIQLACSEASKSCTLGLPANTWCLVANIGDTNAITVKNISTDAGASLARSKIAVCAAGADGALTLTLLN